MRVISQNTRLKTVCEYQPKYPYRQLRGFRGPLDEHPNCEDRSRPPRLCPQQRFKGARSTSPHRAAGARHRATPQDTDRPYPPVFRGRRATRSCFVVMWVTGLHVTTSRGYTPGQCKGRRQRGCWRQGIEWARVDGVILYNLEAIDQRAHEQAANQVASDRGQKVVQLK